MKLLIWLYIIVCTALIPELIWLHYIRMTQDVTVCMVRPFHLLCIIKNKHYLNKILGSGFFSKKSYIMKSNKISESKSLTFKIKQSYTKNTKMRKSINVITPSIKREKAQICDSLQIRS